jgi:transcriptional regulator with XRE-family HTH domain
MIETKTEPVSRVREKREEVGLSQAQLAAAAKTHPSTVSLAERGVAGPNIRKRLARALRLPERELFGR